MPQDEKAKISAENTADAENVVILNKTCEFSTGIWLRHPCLSLSQLMSTRQISQLFSSRPMGICAICSAKNTEI